MKKIISISIAFLILLTVLNIPLANADAVVPPSGRYKGQGATVESLVTAYNKVYSNTNNGTAYSVVLDVPAFKQGSLNAATLQKGIDMINYIRTSAGLGSVVMDTKMNEECQKGALLLAAANVLSHSPPKPAGMPDALYTAALENCKTANIASGFDDNENVFITTGVGYMDDSAANNEGILGHRRWFLGPQMGKTGFGAVNKYSSVRVQDKGNTAADAQRDYVAWPAAGYFPIDMFPKMSQNGQIWSFSLDHTKYDKTKTNAVKVTFTDTATGQTRTYSKASVTTIKQSTDDFCINTGNCGTAYCIMWRNSLVEYNIGDTYSVRIEGIVDTDGKTVPAIEYETCFFAPDNLFAKRGVYDISINYKKANDSGNIYTITGTVKDPDGKGLANVPLNLFIENSFMFYPSKTENDGSFSITPKGGILKNTTFKLSLDSSLIGNYYYNPAESLITVNTDGAAKENYNINIKITPEVSLPGGRVNVTAVIKDRSGNPIKDLPLKLLSDNAFISYGGTTDSNGAYTFKIWAPQNTETFRLLIDEYTVNGVIYSAAQKSVVINTGSVLKGDVNGDNNVNGMDLLLMKQHILGVASKEIVKGTTAFDAADMNNDGVINGMDLLLLKKKILM